MFSALSVLFLVGWQLFGMKSTVGVAIDTVPSIILTAYILRSRRVRRTLVR